MSNSLWVENVQFPIIIGATLIGNAENPIKIGKVFMKKHGEIPTNCQKSHFLVDLSLKPCDLPVKPSNKLIRLNVQIISPMFIATKPTVDSMKIFIGQKLLFTRQNYIPVNQDQSVFSHTAMHIKPNSPVSRMTKG